MEIPWTCEMEDDKALWCKHVHEAVTNKKGGVCNFRDLKDCCDCNASLRGVQVLSLSVFSFICISFRSR